MNSTSMKNSSRENKMNSIGKEDIMVIKNEKFLLTQANDVLKLVEKFSCEKSAKTEIKDKIEEVIKLLKEHKALPAWDPSLVTYGATLARTFDEPEYSHMLEPVYELFGQLFLTAANEVTAQTLRAMESRSAGE